MCQTSDWKVHKPKCVPPQRIVEEHNCIAVPDYQCFFEYQKILSSNDSIMAVGICMLNQETFEDKFGRAALYRTCLALAVNGKPALLLLKLCGKQK